MNNNWQRVKLDDVCDLIAGFAFKGKDFGEEFQSKVIKIADIQPPNVKMDSLTGIDVSKYDESKLQKYRVGIGDYVFAMTGATIGKLGRIQEGEAYINQRVLTFRNNLNVCDKDFLYYVLAQPSFLGYILNHIDSETAQPNISASSVGTFEFYLPPISTQKQIANALRGLDDKIELNNKINRNLEAQAQAIFKSWFIDFEPFKNGKFIDSELGKIPEGWKVEELGKVSKNIREKVVSRTNIPVLSAVKEGRLILSEEYFSKQVYSKSLSKYILVKENDYAYNPARVNIGSLGRNTICSLGCVSPVYIVFEIDSNYLAFFDLYFKMKSFKNEVKLRASGSVRQTLSYDDFSLIKVIYPPKSVSSKFNKLSAVFSEKITRNKKESRRLAQLRDTLLPKLMSGKIDISDVAV